MNYLQHCGATVVLLEDRQIVQLAIQSQFGHHVRIATSRKVSTSKDLYVPRWSVQMFHLLVRQSESLKLKLHVNTVLINSRARSDPELMCCQPMMFGIGVRSNKSTLFVDHAKSICHTLKPHR